MRRLRVDLRRPLLYNFIDPYYTESSRENEVVLLMQMFYVIISLMGNLLIDIVYGFVDPRVRVNK